MEDQTLANYATRPDDEDEDEDVARSLVFKDTAGSHETNDSESLLMDSHIISAKTSLPHSYPGTSSRSKTFIRVRTLLWFILIGLLLSSAVVLFWKSKYPVIRFSQSQHSTDNIQSTPNITQINKSFGNNLTEFQKQHYSVRPKLFPIVDHDKLKKTNRTEFKIKYTEIKAPSETFHYKDNTFLNTLAYENLQNRESSHLGEASKGYVHINTHDNEVLKRRQNMENLDKIRVDYCGSTTKSYIEARQAGVYSHSSTKWHGISKAETLKYKYYKNSIEYASGKMAFRRTFRSYCSASHPTLRNTTVSIERQGPFTSHGDLDWHTIDGLVDVANLKEQISEKNVYVVGTLFAVVDADGKIIGYPPLHIHHAHIYPYGPAERGQRTKLDNDFIQHHVLIQTHGDGECAKDQGGSDCLLHQLPDEQGYRLVNSSGFNGNYEINDVRRGSDVKPKEFYVDIAVMWTSYKRVATTFLQMGNPALGRGWMTYLFPLDPHTNFIYYRYNNRVGPGKISNFIMHTHMSFVDSVYVFKDTKGKVYNSLANYRKSLGNVTTMPYILECHGKKIEDAKREVLTTALNSGAELICEATKPSMELYCDDSESKSEEYCIFRDKRFNLNCLKETRFEEENSIVVIAFNRVRNTSSEPLTRKASLNALAYVSTFGEGYVGHQHTFFRGDFVSDLALNETLKDSTGDAKNDVKIGAYAPPAIFKYASWPQDQYTSNGFDVRKMKRRLLEHCAAPLSYGDVDFPWEKHLFGEMRQ